MNLRLEVFDSAPIDFSSWLDSLDWLNGLD